MGAARSARSARCNWKSDGTVVNVRVGRVEVVETMAIESWSGLGRRIGKGWVYNGSETGIKWVHPRRCSSSREFCHLTFCQLFPRIASKF